MPEDWEADEMSERIFKTFDEYWQDRGCTKEECRTGICIVPNKWKDEQIWNESRKELQDRIDRALKILKPDGTLVIASSRYGKTTDKKLADILEGK